MSKKLSTSDFIKRSDLIHNKKYIYSKVEYKTTDSHVNIICPEHGEFLQTPHNHMRGVGCPYCSDKMKYDSNNFIERFNLIHKGKYDYTKSIFKSLDTKILIICPKHGEFWQKPKNHVNGNGCPLCGIEKRNKSLESNQEIFVGKANMIHNYKYSYTKTKYKSVNVLVTITCPIHGDFTQKPGTHLSGSGCQLCGKSIKKTTSSFISEAIGVHRNRYDYSKSEYRGAYEKICIICPEHGEFLQGARYHLQGQGCPKCQKSLGEIKIGDFLKDKNIEYIEQHRFLDCKNKNTLPFDFYLPSYNMCIEYDGRQHSNTDSKYYSDDIFINDNIKTKYCIDNSVELIRISYRDYKNIEDILIKKINLKEN